MTERLGFRVVDLPDTDAEIAKIVCRESIVNAIREQNQRFEMPAATISEVLSEVAIMYDRENERTKEGK
jgi:hypothetical protein